MYSEEIFIIAVYIDDILTGENDMKDISELHHFLGVKVMQNKKSDEIWIGQLAYMKDLLPRFGMDESKYAALVTYQWELGLISFCCWEFHSQHTYAHWSAIKHILQYLKSMLSLALLDRCKKEMNLVGFSDTDYAGDIQNCWSRIHVTGSQEAEIWMIQLIWNTIRKSIIRNWLI